MGVRIDWRRVPACVWVAPLLLALLFGLYWVSRPGAVAGVENVHRAWVQALDVDDPWNADRLQAAEVSLPHNLDQDGSRWGSQVRYRLVWPADIGYEQPEQAHLALLLPRVGARFQVLLNGQELDQVGWRAERRLMVNAAIEPHYLPLPGVLLTARPQDNRIEILVQRERFERSGLWPLQLGAQDRVYQRYRTLMAWQVGGNWMMLVTTVLMALLASSLWLLQRERLYGLLALASAAHGVRLWLGVQEAPPLPFEACFLLYRIGFSTYCCFLFLFIEELFGYRLLQARRLAYALLALGPLWLLVTLLSGDLRLHAVWAGILALAGCAMLLQILWRGRWGRAMGGDQILVLCVALFTLVTGVRDFLVINLGVAGDADLRWMAPGTLVLMFTLFWVLLLRSTDSMREVIRLNSTLADRIAAREAELHSAFDRLRASEQQRVLESERRRLMRDMHDGLGSQLVQTLNMVRNAKGNLSPESVSSMVQQALEELRLMLDSLEPMDGDLPTILGTLRQRIGPALESAGITLDWQVEEMPPIASLDARGVMNLFRCIQEVFANVVKHAHATQVTVRTWMDATGGLFLAIADNGVGTRAASGRVAALGGGGRGLNNIRSRAEQIGARVHFYDARPGFGIELCFGKVGAGAGSGPAGGTNAD